MATIPVVNFHNEKMAQERARVMIRIANGLKSDSSAVIARRMMNPTFKGLPANSTGSRNMPFFAAINEINTPLEAKIAMRPKGMRGSGAMAPTAQQRPLPIGTHVQETNQLDANPNIIAPPFIPPRSAMMNGGVLKDFSYAKKILNQRKRDIENQMLVKEGMEAQPSELLVLSELLSRKLELAQVLAYYTDQLALGRTDNISILEARNVLRLVVSLSPSFTGDELVELTRIVDNILSKTQALMNDNTPTSAIRERGVADANMLETTETVFTAIAQFLEAMGTVANRSLADKTVLAKNLVAEMGIPDAKRVNKSIDETVQQVIQDVESEESQEDTTTTGTTDLTAPPEDTSAMTTTEASSEVRRGDLIDQVETLYDRNDISGLQSLLRRVAPRLRAEKFFRAGASRTILRNALLRIING